MNHDLQVIVSFVEGITTVSDLRTLGIEIDFQGQLPERTVSVRNPKKLSITVNPRQVAIGFLRNREHPDKLSVWATVILTADDLIELSLDFQTTADGEKLLQGLWDASYEETIDEEVWSVATKLV